MKLFRHFQYDGHDRSRSIGWCLVVFAATLILFGFLCDPPLQIAVGIWKIITTQAGLITDSMMVGGMGAAFVNAGLVVLLSMGLLKLNRIAYSGITIACMFLMAGFSLFGKDIWNIFPIILGGYLYARLKRERFGRYIYISLFGTALAPMVSEIVRGAPGQVTALRYFGGIAIGVLIGFLLPAMAAYTLHVHQGYNLYNVGFTAGLLGMVFVSIFRSFGYTFTERLEWSTGNNLRLAIFLFLLFSVMVLTGFVWNGGSFQGLPRIIRHSGRTVADFVLLDGLPVTLMNMGIVGAFATIYVLVVGGELNGPTIGGIFTICGFGAFGKHMKNIIPVMLGVVLSSLVMVWKLDQPSVLLAALFSTGLAPIAGQFGWKWGIIAGIVHASVVLNVGSLHGGLNLYNNGFAAGLVCVVLIPLIEALHREKEETKEEEFSTAGKG